MNLGFRNNFCTLAFFFFRSVATIVKIQKYIDLEGGGGGGPIDSVNIQIDPGVIGLS